MPFAFQFQFPSLGPLDSIMLMIFGMMLLTVVGYAAWAVWKWFNR